MSMNSFVGGYGIGIRACVLGGDKRQLYVARMLAEAGFEVTCFSVLGISEELSHAKRKDCLPMRSKPMYSGGGAANTVTAEDSLEVALSGKDAVILPFPLSPDGVTLNCMIGEKPRLSQVFSAISSYCPKSVKCFAGAVKPVSAEIARSVGIELIDYGSIEEIARRNAVPTAEGAVEVAMSELDITIRSACTTVIGYGRCGSELARLLKAMGAEVRGVARSSGDRAKMFNDGVRAYGFEGLTEALVGADVIFNTVPVNVIDCDILAGLPEGSLIVELASAPGGVDRECAAEYGVRVIHAASLPGRYAPESAAKIICDAIIPLLLS